MTRFARIKFHSALQGTYNSIKVFILTFQLNSYTSQFQSQHTYINFKHKKQDNPHMK